MQIPWPQGCSVAVVPEASYIWCFDTLLEKLAKTAHAQYNYHRFVIGLHKQAVMETLWALLKVIFFALTCFTCLWSTEHLAPSLPVRIKKFYQVAQIQYWESNYQKQRHLSKGIVICFHTSHLHWDWVLMKIKLLKNLLDLVKNISLHLWVNVLAHMILHKQFT